MKLVEEIYKLTDQFPKKEQFSLIDQIRRAAISIPSNIAEGSQRNSDKEFVRFLYISKSSAAELETQLIVALRLKYASEEDYKHIDDMIDHVQKMLFALIKKLHQN